MNIELIYYDKNNIAHVNALQEFKYDKGISEYVHKIDSVIENKLSKLISYCNNIVGILLITKLNRNTFSIEYGILEKYRGNGYASIALQLGSNDLFENHGCETVVLQIDKSNIASMNTAMKAGFDVDYEADSYGEFLEFYKLSNYMNYKECNK